MEYGRAALSQSHWTVSRSPEGRVDLGSGGRGSGLRFPIWKMRDPLV